MHAAFLCCWRLITNLPALCVLQFYIYLYFGTVRLTASPVSVHQDRLEQVFDGRPYDLLDAALTDTVANFPVDIQARLSFTRQHIGL